MPYTDHYQLVEDVTNHFDVAIATLDPLLVSKYTGFFAVSSAAVLELALKDIIIEFAILNNSLFGQYVASRYERINGRIKLEDFHKEHLKPFGQTYRTKFKRRLSLIDRHFMRQQSFSVSTAYENLLTCRHTFAHEGVVPMSMTYQEVKRGFEAGKLVMSCLARTLRV